MAIKPKAVCCVCLHKPEEFVACDSKFMIILYECCSLRTCYLYTAEKECSVHGHGEHWDSQRCHVRGAVEIDPDMEIRIIRKGVLR